MIKEKNLEWASFTGLGINLVGLSLAMTFDIELWGYILLFSGFALSLGSVIVALKKKEKPKSRF